MKAVTNWAKNLTCYPQSYTLPESEEDVVLVANSPLTNRHLRNLVGKSR